MRAESYAGRIQERSDAAPANHRQHHVQLIWHKHAAFKLTLNALSLTAPRLTAPQRCQHSQTHCNKKKSTRWQRREASRHWMPPVTTTGALPDRGRMNGECFKRIQMLRPLLGRG